MTQPQTAEDYEAALIKDYSAYVAKEPIFIDGVRAFNRGNAVPASHVDSGVVSPEQVEKLSTKAGRAVVETTEG